MPTDKLYQLYQRLSLRWGISWLKDKKKILGSIVLGAISAALVYVSVRLHKGKSITINMADAKKRIDRERQEKIENLIRETKRIDNREDILKELNRNSHFN